MPTTSAGKREKNQICRVAKLYLKSPVFKENMRHEKKLESIAYSQA